MQEFSTPEAVTVGPTAALTDAVRDHAATSPDEVLFARKLDGRWAPVTAKEFATEVSAVAAGLIASGVGPGDRVGLMSKTRYEWTLVDYAIWAVGAVTVPVYETSSAEQVSWILSDSGATACFVETNAHALAVAGLRDGLPALRQVWQIDLDDLDRLRERGAAVDPAEIDARRRAIRADDIATIIYTSGTTGRPKGCVLTHRNIHADIANAVPMLPNLFHEGAATLLFLPLAHAFARLIQVGVVQARAKMAHCADPRDLVGELQAVRPTFVLSVPRVFEKIYNSAEATAEAGGKGKIFKAAADTAIAWSEAHDTGGPGLALKVRHALFDRLVYSKLRARLGGQVQFAVSGGAPLGARLGHFFRGVGILVLEGWGLTETTAPATVGTPSQIRIGTVGRPLPGVAVRVEDDGELSVRGINVLKGYFNNPQATAESLEDGWFHTGDLGEIDEGGFVRITGRKKEILVTAGGKNVAPTVLEDRLRAHVLVSQCMVVGDQRPYIGALVTLDAEMLPTWLSNNGKPAMDVATAAKDPDVLAEVQKAVDTANLAVSKAEAIRRFSILDTDFTEAGGHLTPKLSLKRAVVLKEFAGPVESLYV